MKNLLFFLLLLLSFSVDAQGIRIAVASNFLSTLKSMAPTFEREHNIRLLISSGSSGKHFAQIVNGAPFDIILAADRSYVSRLDELGLLAAETRFIYAQGQLVLWSRRGESLPSWERLNDKMMRRLAIANPKTAPYGLAAKQVLEHLGNWHLLKKRIVKGESIGQAFQFVASGNVEFGFVALSQVLSATNRFNREKYWLVPQGYYTPLQQEAALFARSKNNNAAKLFLKYLKSQEARNVIQRSGYL